MNISEANAVNTVVRALTGKKSWDGSLPSVDEQQTAVDVLLRKAHRVLSAGLQPGDVTVGGQS